MASGDGDDDVSSSTLYGHGVVALGMKYAG
jgi:hypothetical protein